MNQRDEIEHVPFNGWTAVCLVGLATIAGCVEPDAADEDADTLEWRYVPPTDPDTLLPTPSSDAALSLAYTNGVVTTSEQFATEVGRDVLGTVGRNAIDAAVAVQAMLNVVEPQSSGLGGGAVWLVHLTNPPPGKQAGTFVIDCREFAPGAATATMFTSESSSTVKESSGISVGVPGALRCMETALTLGGTTTLQNDLLDPAIDAAEHGFPVSERLADATGSSRLGYEIGTPAYDEARKVFRKSGSLDEGETLVQTNLANTFKAIKARGASAFYDCADVSGIASAIVTTQQARRKSYANYSKGGGKGTMTCKDLTLYNPQKVVVGPPIERTYRSVYTIKTAPPPTSGVHLLQELLMLETFPLGTSTFKSRDFYTLNVMQEAMRRAFADRAMWLGDPNYPPLGPVPVTGLLHPDYLAKRTITKGVRTSTVRAGDPRPYNQQALPLGTLTNKPPPGQPPEGPDTTHFTILDGAGNMVSVSSTISTTWGSTLMALGKGFMLNDQLRNFNDKPTYNPSSSSYNPGANDVRPFKRPRTTLAPTMIFLGGKPIAAFGSPGSTGILHAVLSFLLNLVDHKMTLQQAVAEPRISLDSASNGADTEIEPGFPSSVRSALDNMGYDFDSVSEIGAVQGVILSKDGLRQFGTADPRRNGVVEGLLDPI